MMSCVAMLFNMLFNALFERAERRWGLQRTCGCAVHMPCCLRAGWW
jgi:uncharacterized membrane protein